MKKLILSLLLLYIPLCASTELLVMTENHFPPYNYMEDTELRGSSVEITKELLKRVDINTKIELAPWDKAYKIALSEPNIALFSTVRSKEREDLFEWVGPIGAIEMVFMAKKDFPKEINSIEDLQSVKSIGLQVKEDYSSQILVQKGFKNLTYTGVNSLNSLYLYTGKIDLWFGTDYQMIEQIKNMKLNPQDFKIVYWGRELGLDTKLYIALSKRTDKRIVERLQNALDAMKKDGSYQKIIDSYRK